MIALTRRLLPFLARRLPRMSETERIAMEAGTVWWDAALFSGAPPWETLLDFRIRDLSPRERAFLEGPVEELCRMTRDWEVERAGDLPPEVWHFIKSRRFFGMIIPEEYGGLGFGARAHSAVIVRLCSRSPAVAVTVMVPNSLGPAELLLRYGTEEQKRHYLPRLAVAEEIPCFALTEPGAGSDAASLRATGVVCRGKFEGREVLGMRLEWDKRYTTLGPIATVIALAFRLRDPERLLGGSEDLGITLALVPARLRGIEIGSRHDPLGIAFLNGPNHGRDVFAPLDCIIGGPGKAGHGWRMLMECLAAGRSISMPSLSAGIAQLSTRVAGSYATVREQFGIPVGRFEGLHELLARIGGHTYLIDSARRLTLGAVDAGERPSVLSAIGKYRSTESMRIVINDAMEVLGGAAITRGPRNPLASSYPMAPIGVTVEGANILTRSLIIYGQGALRCHPWLLEEMAAAKTGDVPRLDRALSGHLRFFARNAARAIGHAWTGALLARAPRRAIPAVRPYFRQLTRLASAFAFVSDVSLVALGGRIKRMERVSGRLADILASMYLASAALKRFEDERQPESDLPYLRWACEHEIGRAERTIAELLDNFPVRGVAALLRVLVLPFGVRSKAPSDSLETEAARGLLDDHPARIRLTPDVFVPAPEEPGLGFLEDALDALVAAAPLRARTRELLSDRDRRLIAEAIAAREKALHVDAFAPESLQTHPPIPEPPAPELRH